MDKNLFSLLSSNWMIADSSKNQLIPYLFNLIKGDATAASTIKLPATTHQLISSRSKAASGARSTLSNASTEQVAVVNVHHPIFKYDQECGPKGTQSIMNMMEEWKNDSSIVGVLFDVNSGGGQASGNAEFAEYLNTYSKPTGVFTKDAIGSAAYYFSSGANFIMAHQHADFIGCIGTMHYSVNMEGVLIKAGATINEWYADMSPEKNKQVRAAKEGDERPFVEKLLNPSAQKFQEDVKKYRPQVSELALKGDIFNPTDALEQGLIDSIGTLQDAIDKIMDLHQSSNQSINNNSKSNKMSAIKLPLIESVIGSKFEEDETKDGIILTEEHSIAIEEKLAENEEAISTANDLATEKEQKITELNTANSAINTAMQNALADAEVEGAEKMSIEEGITALSNLVAEYGAGDGGKTTQTINSVTKDDDDAPMVVSGIDLTAALNN